MTKTSSFPNQLELDREVAVELEDRVDLLNRYFQSVFSDRTANYIKIEGKLDAVLRINDFSVSTKRIQEALVMLDVTKSRGPDRIPPQFLQILSKPMGVNLNNIFRTVKRLETVTDMWKIGAVSPICKARSKTSVTNYRPVTLLNVISKVFEKCVKEPLNIFFMEKVAPQQHGFIKKESLYTNLLNYLKKVFTALDDTGTNEVISFYTDFAKAFDKVPNEGLIVKLQRLGVSGCLLRVLTDYFKGTKHKMNLYKTMIMPMLSYASACITLSRSTIRSLENLQKRVLRWASNDKSANYHFILEKANVLPIPMYFQLLSLLLLSDVFHDSEKRKDIMIPATKAIARDNTVRFDVPRSRTERMQTEFLFRSCRIANQLPREVDFFNPIGLKRRLTIPLELFQMQLQRIGSLYVAVCL